MTEPGTFTEQNPIRVFLLDDHEVVRRGLTDLLDAEPDIAVVGDAGTVEHALVRGPALRPHVAVLDVRLPDGDGITVCRELRSQMPELACLMLTSFDDEDALLDAIMAGASGYVLKQIKGSDLVSAVRTVASGQSMLDPATTARLMRSLRADPVETPVIAPELASLSPRERDILTLIGDGLTNREIGKKLYLSEKTVKNHISRLLAKLGVQRRVQAAVLATHREQPDSDGRPPR
jgi:two-component system, NarL family, response regulator DevR